jgi:tRNA threonylcarbamoyl adenosine modification protein YjeE
MHSTFRASEPPPVLAEQVADEPGLAPLAARLVAALPRPAFLAISGDLGAGKTTFVKNVVAACGLDPAEVISPTFGLIHAFELPSRPGLPHRLIHADLYRLGGVADLAETGWEDATAGDTWVFVEWPERIAAALPAERIDVVIQIESPTARRFRLTGHGPAHAAAIGRLATGRR